MANWCSAPEVKKKKSKEEEVRSGRRSNQHFTSHNINNESMLTEMREKIRLGIKTNKTCIVIQITLTASLFVSIQHCIPDNNLNGMVFRFERLIYYWVILFVMRTCARETTIGQKCANNINKTVNVRFHADLSGSIFVRSIFSTLMINRKPFQINFFGSK